MKALLKKGIALLMAVLMVFSIPIYSFAQGEQMTLTTSGKCYAGVTYDVTATINNLTKEQVIGNDTTVTAFSWSANNNAQINTTNTYKITEGENGIYSVSETAKISFSEEVGTTTITAEYGSDFSKSIDVTTVQPITSISISPVNNNSENYYYESAGETAVDTLYLNSYVKNAENFAYLNFDVTPAVNDDSITAGVSNSKYTQIAIDNDSKNLAVAFSAIDAPAEDTITVSPASGYKFSKKIKLIECTPLDSYKLKVGTQEIATAQKDYEDLVAGSLSNCIIGDSITFSPASKSPASANDSICYKLYNPDGSPAPSSYYSYDSNGNCSLSPSNPGTYTLVSYAVSKGNRLARYVGANIKITFSEANPITSINLYNITDEGVFDTESTLDSITLYTTTKKTYDLSQNVSALPVGHSHGVKYTSDNTSVATVNEKTGIVTAVASGTANIFVSSEKNSNIVTSCQVNVVQELTEITSISSETNVLPQGHSIDLVAIKKPTTSGEGIRWSSSNSAALYVDPITGRATANEDYDLNGQDKIYVQVTATSDSGKYSEKYITVVPSIPADNLQASVSAESATENEDGSYKIFNTKPFNLYAEATDNSGEKSNDVFLWYVSLNNGSQVDFDTAKANGYFTYKYEETLDTYTITPATAGKYDFYCYAIKRGQLPGDNVSCVTVNVVPMATKVSILNGTSAVSTLTAPTGTSYTYVISMEPSSAYNDDPVIFTSSNTDVVTVEKIGNDKVTINTGITGTAVITYQTISGSKTGKITVYVKDNLNFAVVDGVESEYTYTGTAIKPVPKLTYNGVELIAGRDYNASLTYSNNTNVGTATIKITGINNYASSTKTITFNIVPKPLTDDDVTFTIQTGAFASITDTNPTPILQSNYSITDTTRKTKLSVNKDFTLSATDNNVAGDATLIATGCGNYCGTISGKYIVKDAISKATITAIPNQRNTGLAITPNIKVVYNNRVLTKDTDYVVRYANNVAIGKATVTITGIGYFTGTLTGSFNIIPATSSGVKCSARTATSVTLTWNVDRNVEGYQIYNAVTKKVIKTISGNTNNKITITGLSPATVYQFRVRGYKTVGGVRYYGLYSGTLYTYTKPKTPTLKLATGSRYIKGSWAGISGVTGYQIQLSSKSSFASAKTTTLSYKTKSKKYTKLTKGKIYYVRVRSYKKLSVNGKTVTVYSSWSTKKIRCK